MSSKRTTLTLGAGLQFADAILHFDAWHMLSSFPQYLFLLSCFYAIANWRDVSWGSKAGKADLNINSLPSIRMERGEEGNCIFCFSGRQVRGTSTRGNSEEEVPASANRVQHPQNPHSLPQANPATVLVAEDSINTFRTRLVAAYIFSNFLLCILVINASFEGLHFLVCALMAISPLSSVAFSRASTLLFRLLTSLAQNHTETHISTRFGSSAYGCGLHQLVSCPDLLEAVTTSCNRSFPPFASIEVVIFAAFGQKLRRMILCYLLSGGISSYLVRQLVTC